MGSGIFYPAVAEDDGSAYSPDPNFSVNLNYVRFGKSSVNSDQWFNSFIRFASVDIPQGSVIKSAYMRFTAYASHSTVSANTTIYFNGEDDAVAPTSAAEFSALSLGALVAWGGIPEWVDGTQYDTPDITCLLQEIIDRAGFISGNAVMAIVNDNESADLAGRSASAIDYNISAEKPELHVEWDPPLEAEAEDETATWNPGDKGSNITLDAPLLTATHA